MYPTGKLSEEQVLQEIRNLHPIERQSMSSAYDALSSKFLVDKDLFPFLYLDWYNEEREASEIGMIYKTLGL